MKTFNEFKLEESSSNPIWWSADIVSNKDEITIDIAWNNSVQLNRDIVYKELQKRKFVTKPEWNFHDTHNMCIITLKNFDEFLVFKKNSSDLIQTLQTLQETK